MIEVTGKMHTISVIAQKHTKLVQTSQSGLLITYVHEMCS